LLIRFFTGVVAFSWVLMMNTNLNSSQSNSSTIFLEAPVAELTQQQSTERKYLVEEVGSLAVVQLYADGFEQLTPKQRVLAYYLAQAGIAGDPIYYDQISPYGLDLKQLLEGIWTHPKGIAPETLEEIRHYTKLIWIYHGNYDLDNQHKFLPEFTSAELRKAAQQALKNGANFGVKTGKALDAKLKRLEQPVFDPNYRPLLTVKSPPPGQDVLTASATNLYENVTSGDLENFTEKYPLNSTVVKRGGKIREEVWRAGTPDGKIPPGRYAAIIHRIIAKLEKAAEAAEPQQADALRKLITFYETGSKADWYAYNIAWVKARVKVDAINGFIEQYLDPRSKKGAYESTVSFVDEAQTKLMRDFADNAQYFELRAPWRDEFKKRDIKPPVANVITVVSEAGASGPISPSGVNLPNEQDIRQQYGSKSVLLFNVSSAYASVVGQKAAGEFSSSDEEKRRAELYGQESRKLLVAMHEVLGHGSGKVSAKLAGDPRSYLKEYYSTLEEARSDLVALWNFTDPKLAELGVKNQDEMMKASYDAYARAGLTLLYRYPQGEQIHEDHDRGTQMIVHYLMDRFGCIEAVTNDGKIYLRVNDYQKMHQGVGELLAELMRIKAEGNYDGIKKLIDAYGVKLNPEWRDQVQQRAASIELPRKGVFVSPLIEPLRDGSGNIIDARAHHTGDLAEVMLTYSRESLGYLPAQ
jgi:dipeptidyl-peptidase-3